MIYFTLFKCVLVQAVPAAAAVPATVEVCFSPEDDCAEFAERAIAGAQREILVSAYRLTVGSGVVGALIRAKERGVDVRVIADRAAPCGRASGIEPLAKADVPVWIDKGARLAPPRQDNGHRRRGHAPRLVQLDPRRWGELGGSQPDLVPSGRGSVLGALAPALCCFGPLR